MSIVRFSRRDERERRSGGSPISGRPSTEWTVDPRADDVEEARDDVDLDVAVLELADQVERLLVRVAREARSRRSTSSRRTIGGSCSGAPRSVELVEVGAPLLRLAVDEADEVDPVLGVLEQLARDDLADVAGADDDRVLQVGDVPARESAGDGAAER